MQRIYRVDMEKASDAELDVLRQQYMDNPQSLLEVDEEDKKHLDNKLNTFLNDCLSPGLDGYVLGLSGGLDSSLCAYLATESGNKVFGMILSSGTVSTDEGIRHALRVSEENNIPLNNYAKVRENLDDVVHKTLEMSETPKNHKKWKVMVGNTYARERMKILRNKALELNYLVLGTTNATEEWLGYATKAGDGLGGIDVEPLLLLPKTSERIYARMKGVPSDIIDKNPSAELWEGQTDEKELTQWVGSPVSYETIDLVMTDVNLGLSKEQIVEANNHEWITPYVVDRLKQIHKGMQHKSNLPQHTDFGD